MKKGAKIFVNTQEKKKDSSRIPRIAGCVPSKKEVVAY